MLVVLGRFARPEPRLRKELAGASRAHQVAHQIRRRNEAAAIIAEIDDDVGDALRAEIGKGVAELVVRRRDEGSQVQIAIAAAALADDLGAIAVRNGVRSEEHTSELQSLMRSSYAVFCLKKKKPKKNKTEIKSIQ